MGGGGGDGLLWVMMGMKKVLRFCSKFFQMKFRWYKCAEIWNICEKKIVSEKIPTSIFKNWGFFGRKKSSLISLKFLSDEAQVIWMCPQFIFCDVKSLSGKKSDLKFKNLEIVVQILMGNRRFFASLGFFMRWTCRLRWMWSWIWRWRLRFEWR